MVLMLVNCIDLDKPCAKSNGTSKILEVPGITKLKEKIKTAVTKPFTISDVRKPKRRRTGVVTLFMSRLPANIASTRRPDRNAFRPKASWNIKGSRKGDELIAIRNSEPPKITIENVGAFRHSRLMS